MRISDWSSDVCSADDAPSKPGEGARLEEDVLVEDAAPDRLHRHQQDVPGDSEEQCRGQPADQPGGEAGERSEEHTSELQSLMRISYAVFCLKKKIRQNMQHILHTKLTDYK